MSGRRVLLAACLAGALVWAALPATARAANECNGIPKCVAVPGPWVAVPATGEADYLLECPGGKGLVGGTDANVSSQHIYVTFDALPASPIGQGKSTNFEVLFRAESGNHRFGYFQPFLGCIPTQSSARDTTGVVPLGPPLDLHASTAPIKPGAVGKTSVACPSGESLASTWTATAFQTQQPPTGDLAAAITVKAASAGVRASASVEASEALPPGSGALVQLGVKCAPG